MDGFIILDKIGEGSFSSVYKVKRIEDGIVYALKRVKFTKLKEKEKLNSLNEIRILSSINNQNVISYKEAFFVEKDSTLNIIMEYADKGDLLQLISEYKKKKEHFKESEIWDALIQLLNGLKSLHDLNILHRDLKSANVFLFSNGLAKLGDLNVSKVTRKGLGYTQTGTPYYASPEVWQAKAYDSKSDIWSLGCIIYEMAKLVPPFQAKDMEELYKKIIRGFYPQIPSIYSDDLKEIIKLMIQTEVGARPSCDELLKMPIILKKYEEINKNLIELNNNDNEKKLLSTIRIPSKFSNFTKDLPKPKYYSPSPSEQYIKKNKNKLENSVHLHSLILNKNKINVQDLVEDKKGNENNIRINDNKISSPNKNKANNKEIILSENKRRKINKIPSLVNPAYIVNSSRKEKNIIEKLYLPDIRNSNNIKNYNSIEKVKSSKKIKIINNNSVNKIPIKVLQSENNVKINEKKNNKAFGNIRLGNYNEKKKFNNNIKNIKPICDYNYSNNMVNRVMKNHFNLMKRSIKHNKEENK